eukprot:m.107446 g.107446  ORF g.107446 m.107446 type:complete len:396 (+) comp13930_c0_seq1:46-1233(+)
MSSKLCGVCTTITCLLFVSQFHSLAEAQSTANSFLTPPPKQYSLLSCTDLGFSFLQEKIPVCASSYIFESCHTDVDWTLAEAICSGAGARLCTALELQENVAKGSGCGLENKLVWTSQQCGEGNMLAVLGEMGEKSLEQWQQNMTCSNKNATIGSVRCCGDAKSKSGATIDPSPAVEKNETFELFFGEVNASMPTQTILVTPADIPKKKIDTMQTALLSVGAVVAFLAVCLLILVWYLSRCAKYDMASKNDFPATDPNVSFHPTRPSFSQSIARDEINGVGSLWTNPPGVDNQLKEIKEDDESEESQEAPFRTLSPVSPVGVDQDFLEKVKSRYSNDELVSPKDAKILEEQGYAEDIDIDDMEWDGSTGEDVHSHNLKIHNFGDLGEDFDDDEDA